MSKVKNKIFGVTIARYAWIYVDAETPAEAMEIVSANLDSIEDELYNMIEEQFKDSNTEVIECDAEPSEIDISMDYIYADGGVHCYDWYIDQLNEDE